MGSSSTLIAALFLAVSAKAWSGNSRASRRDWLETIAATTASVLVIPRPVSAMYNDPKTGFPLPEEGEIASSIPTDWSGVENPVDESDKNLMMRLDKTPDSQFYAAPRFVEHVDENAVRKITEYIRTQAIGDRVAVLDLCSSWTSHIDSSASAKLERVAGLGMNAKELETNPSLTEWIIKDLNEDPTLPYQDASFDVVLCQLSIDYLTRPLQVLKEAGRVLRRGGKVHILFSNRLFLQKAVALWTGADDIDHAYTVACYLHFSGADFKDISAQDLSTRKGKRIVGDPLYVVSAVKS